MLKPSQNSPWHCWHRKAHLANALLTAVELRACTALREVSLESNRLTTPVMDLRSLSQLQSLQLLGNPLVSFCDTLLPG